MMGIRPDLGDMRVDIVSTLTPPPVDDVDLAQAKRTVGDRLCLKGFVDLLCGIDGDSRLDPGESAPSRSHSGPMQRLHPRQ